jgi:hypothetical protein
MQKLKRHGNGGSCFKKHEKLKLCKLPSNEQSCLLILIGSSVLEKKIIK